MIKEPGSYESNHRGCPIRVYDDLDLRLRFEYFFAQLKLTSR